MGISSLHVGRGGPVMGGFCHLLLLLLCMCCCRAQVYNLSLLVDEGLPPGTLVGDIRAGLPEGSPGEGFFLSEEDGESLVLQDFQVDSGTGIVRTLRVLDREKRERYSFIAATLQGEVVQVEILVRDVNDHPPSFPVPSLRLQVSELTPPGTSFRLPAALDPDTGEHGLRGYTLIKGTQGTPFIIRYGEANQGSTNGADDIKKELTSWGQEGPSSAGLGEVRGHGGILEDRADSRQVGVGIHGTMTEWGIYPSDDTEHSRLEIDRKGPWTGTHIFNGVPVDGAGRHKRDIAAYRRGNLLDGNEETQSYLLGAVTERKYYIAELEKNGFYTEGHEYGSYIGRGDKEDRIGSEEDGHSDRTDPRLHPLDLVLVHWLDREELDRYQLEVEAFDGGYPRRTGRLLVDITVLDANDNPPTFDQAEYHGWVWESAPMGTPICTVHATDPDLGNNGQVSYSIRAGDGYFTVEEASGVIMVSRPLDREQRAFHQLVVQAHDGGTQPEVSSVLLTIRVLDINDNRPHIQITLLTDSGQPEVSEGARMGEYLARISVSDPDLESKEELEGEREGKTEGGGQSQHDSHTRDAPGEMGDLGLESKQQQLSRNGESPVKNVSTRSKEQNQHVSVSLDGGDGSFSLHPAGPQLFFLCVEGPLDRELQDLYELRLLAWDSGSPPLQSQKTLLLKVTDINDQPPVFLQPEGYQATVSEAASPGTAVLRLSALDLDEDGPNSSVTYFLQTSPSSHLFLLDSHTGVMTITHTLDHEADPVLDLVAVATDQGNPPLSSTCQVTITIEDVNDNEPVFQQQFYNVSIPEHAPLGHCFLQVKATDVDSGPFGQIQYSVYDDFHNSKKSQTFWIDPNDGRICVSQDIDREGHPGSYDLLVKAKDEGGLSSQAFVRIEVEDINDNAPAFDSTSYVTSISSHTQPGTEIINVMATDKDEGIFGEVTYEFLPGDFSSLFTIDSSTGIIYLISALSHLEDSRVSLSVSARDKGGLTSSVNAAVTVNILKTIVAPAIFEKSRYTFSIAEDVPKDSAVGTVKAREPLNSVEPISYRILSGDLHQLFTIHPQFGVIRTKKQLDHESQSLVVLTVQSQLGSSNIFSSTQVNITVTDINDNAPCFPVENDKISIYQNTAPGTAIYIVHAEDIDSGYNGLITYSIASEKQDMFIIDPNLGILYLNNTLPVVCEYTVIIMAEDNGHPILNSFLTLTISVEKQKEGNVLKFGNLVHKSEISESFPIHARILQVNAYIHGTPSPTTKIVYSLGPVVDSVAFGIQRSTGWIFLRRPLDYEETKMYNLKVIASSIEDREEQTATTSVIVKILDDNDNSPMFDQNIYFFTIEENPAPQGVIGTIRAFDRDSGNNGHLSYYLLSEGNYFLVSSKTGEIINCAALDHEQKSHHELTVLVTDHGTPRRNATSTVYIKIADLNDNKPYFPQVPSGKQLNFKVLEAQSDRVLVASLYAKDPDAGANGTVVYSLSSDDNSVNFIINTSSGEIWTTKALSSSLKSQYRLIVTASDQGTPALQQHVVVNIQIIPTRKSRSHVLPGIKNVMVPESVEPGQVIGSVKIHEDKLLQNKKVHYRIADEENSGHFVIDSSTGDIYLSRQLDYETNSHYMLSVSIQDYNKIPPQNHSLFIRIGIEDQNDHFPLFIDPMVVIGIYENVPIGTVLHTFVAKDADGSLQNSKIKYSLSTDDINHNPFHINEGRGTLTTVMELDRETKPSFIIKVIATDQAVNIAHQRQSSMTAKIVILDINDNSPQFVSLPFAFVAEDTEVGSLVHHIVAEDLDEGRNGKITFYIMEGNVKQAFWLDKTTGWLTLYSRIDREFQSQYILSILAVDDGTPALSATQTLTITVTDVNDEAPRFKQLVYEAGVPENQERGLFVMRLEAEDSDSGINSVLTFQILPDTAHGLFKINSETGELVTAATFDREEQDLFVIKVLVTDGGSPSLSSTTTIMCTILDENDNTPEFLFPDVDIQIPENQDLGIIHTALAVDKDAGSNGSLQFQIIGGNTGGYFAINNTSGELWATRNLDREDVSNFTIIVECHDLGSPRKSSTAKVLINVLDQNDNPPTFSKSQYRTSVREDLTVGSVVLNLQASDIDEGLNGEVMYSLIDDTQGILTINSSTGVVVTTRTLDRELKHQYVFRVVASDCSIHGPKSTTVKVLVQIEDVNDNSPIFSENPIHVLLSSKILVNKTVATVSASDLDLGLNGAVVFNLLKPNPFFRINRETGDVNLQMPLPPDSLRSTILIVEASDFGVPANTARGLVIFHGQGLEKDISFAHNLYEAIVLENSVMGTKVVTVEARHHISNGEGIRYSIFSQDVEEVFSINSVTGELTVKEPTALDFEVRNKINVIVSAEISGYVSYCRVTVFIQDDNDNSPVFEQNHQITYVLEGQVYNTFVIQVFASDADSGINGQIDYSITSGNENKAFLIDSRRGILTTNAILDREIKTSYRLVLQATDRGTPSLSATSIMTVLVVDINDNAPTIPPFEPVLIPEDAAIGHSVRRVTANDVDLNSTLMYNFTENGNPGRKFAIDRYSGLITLIDSLDYEETSLHYLRIQASDLVHNTEAELTIEILDVNDNPPLFTEDCYKVNVPELTPSDTFIVSVSATDKDSELYGPITYKILSPLKGFRINSTSGSVYTDMPVGIQEKSTVLQVLIEANDNGKPPLASSTILEIFVNDVNNYAPRFSEEDYNVHVSEDILVGETVLTFTATDLDWTYENAYIDFSVISGNENNLFYVESIRVLSQPPYVVYGKLLLNAILDRETTSTHKLVLHATNNGSPTLSSNATVLINVLDSNDNPPVFGKMEYHINAREHHPVNSSVIEISANDLDIGDNADISYSIVSGNDGNFFIVDEQNGSIILIKPLNYEDIRQYTLTLQATDSWASKQNTAFSIISIAILDENDFSPKFIFNSLNCNLYENVPSFSPVCTVNAIDLDLGPYGILTYSIQSSCLNDHHSQNMFFIDSLTGDIYTKHKIDYEMQKQFCLIVQVKDRSESTACVLVYVDIEGRDEFQPVFNQDHYLFDLPRENNPGQAIGKVEALDDDDGVDGLVQYFLEGPSQFFSINVTSGMIYLTRTVYKKRNKSKKYDDIVELYVKAKSPNFDSKSATCTVRVNISTALEGYPGMSANILSISFSISFVVFLLLAISLIGIILRYKRKDVINACGIKENGIPALPMSNMKECISDDCPKYENIKTSADPDTSEWLGLVGIREKKDSGSKCRNSDSSGHGSTEGENAEDEEIKMINEYPIRKECGSVLSERASRVPDSGIPRDSDLLSCESDETDLVIGTESTESIINMKDEGGEEECNTSFNCEKEFQAAQQNTEKKEKDKNTNSDTRRDYIFVPTTYDSRYGSLASLVASDEDLRGSYNWDYLLSWEPRFQTLSSVFCDIGRLKDEKMHRHGLPKHKKPFVFPPPLITSVAQPGIRAVPPRMPTIMSGQTFMKYPRSPFFTNLACQPSAMSPSFSPSLSMLTVHTPTTSPVHSDAGITGTLVPTLSEELLAQQEFQV
ncbi:protocadherin-23 [Discoglossus pictus]